MNICFFGDSLTLGVGAPAGLGWPGRICAKTFGLGKEFTAYNLGVRTQASVDIEKRWLAEAEPRLPGDTPAGVVFSFGAVDGVREVDLEDTLAAAEAMFTESAKRWTTLYIGPPPVLDETARERVRAVNRALLPKAAESGVDALDLFDVLERDPGYMADLEMGDGVHPGARGYDALAMLAWSFPPMRELLGCGAGK